VVTRGRGQEGKGDPFPSLDGGFMMEILSHPLILLTLI